MKKLYWTLMSLIMVSAVLDIIFSIFSLKIPTLIASIILVILVLIEVVFYMCMVRFKCQKCNTIFKGRAWEIFFAPHTPTKRYMRCPMCNERLWCEDCFEKEVKKENKDVK